MKPWYQKEKVWTTGIIVASVAVIAVVLFTVPQPSAKPVLPPPSKPPTSPPSNPAPGPSQTKAIPQPADYDALMWISEEHTHQPVPGVPMKFIAKKWPDVQTLPDGYFTFVIPACKDPLTITSDMAFGGGGGGVTSVDQIPGVRAVTNQVLLSHHLFGRLGTGPNASINWFSGSAPGTVTMYIQTEEGKTIPHEDWRLVIIAAKRVNGAYTLLWDKVVTPSAPPK